MLIQQLLAIQQTQKVDEEIVSERYDTSADWDADMDKLQEHLKAAMDIINSENWAEHIESTQNNFDVPGLSHTHDKLYNAIEEAINLASDVYAHMEEAS